MKIAARAALHAALCFGLLSIGGCAAGPNYRSAGATELPLPTQWLAPLPHQGQLAALSQWWLQFDDPVLGRLIDAAERSHPQLDAALGVIREARAGVGSAGAARLPQLAASGSASRVGGDSSSGVETPYSLLGGALDASWELDLFGGNRRNSQAARARLDAAEAQWDEARVSLAAEVADAYVSRRHCERLLQIQNETLSSRQQTLQLTELKLASGAIAPAEAAQARAAVFDSDNQRGAQQGLCQQQLNRLAALSGLSAAALQEALQHANASGAIPVLAQPAVPSIPADLLSQRPDLRISERNAAAASAEIGVAVASRLPSLTLLGNIGINRIDRADLTTRSWSWGPSLRLPIFEGGAGRAREEAARARYDQAMADYRHTVLGAVNEVEDALVRVDAASRRIDSAQQAALAYGESLQAQQQRYQLGAGSLLELEDIRRLSLASHEALAGVQLELAEAWIALYKAVGGGWDTAPAASPPMPSPSAAHAVHPSFSGAGA